MLALDNRRPIQLQKLLGASGYTTAVVGKWHLGHGVARSVYGRGTGESDGVPADPAGFDHWCVLPGQGLYQDPVFYRPDGEVTIRGYASDIITDLSLDWLSRGRDASRPFFLCVHHKAPHRPWTPGEKYKHLYEDEDLPLPETFGDDYTARPAAEAARMRVMGDLNREDVKADPPAGLGGDELASWYYQRYIKDYLRCVASVDASVGRLLDYLDEADLAENTIVIYTSDQGFFLGDHGWYDKRFIYEESLRMPFLMRFGAEVPAGSVREEILTNTDFAPTLLDCAGVAVPDEMQGLSARAMLRGQTPSDWQRSFYYRYWDHGGHGVMAHYGVRTHTHKLVYYCDRLDGGDEKPGRFTVEPYWELYDLAADPRELCNVYGDAAYAAVQRDLLAELERLQRKYGDQPKH